VLIFYQCHFNFAHGQLACNAGKALCKVEIESEVSIVAMNAYYYNVNLIYQISTLHIDNQLSRELIYSNYISHCIVAIRTMAK
jgi:hypothetical protein